MYIIYCKIKIFTVNLYLLFMYFFSCREAEIENNMLNNKCLVIKENLKRDQHMCNKKNICNKKTLFRLVILSLFFLMLTFF